MTIASISESCTDIDVSGKKKSDDTGVIQRPLQRPFQRLVGGFKKPLEAVFRVKKNVISGMQIGFVPRPDIFTFLEF